MNFATLLVIALFLVTIGLIIYYFAYYKNQAPTNYTSPIAYSTNGIGDVVSNVSLMSPDQMNLFLGENFTLSYYITLTNPGNITSTGTMSPILWVAGVGALVVDMASGNVSMAVTSAPYDPSNPSPTTQTVSLTGTRAGLFFNKWHQITMTVSGARVCVYVDGNQQGNCISLPNVPLGAPSGLYFLQGQGPAAVLASLQAYPRVLSSTEIAANYKSTSDSSGNPTNIPSSTVSFSDMGKSLVTLFCKTGLCPPNTSGDVRLGPFQQINYEYS